MESYDDFTTCFLLESIKRIDYFSKLSSHAQRTIIYSMKSENFAYGTHLLKEGDACNSMFIIATGIAEVYVKFENGIEFPIENLSKGTILNPNSFLIKNQVLANIRCVTPVSLYFLDRKTLDEL